MLVHFTMVFYAMKLVTLILKFEWVRGEQKVFCFLIIFIFPLYSLSFPRYLSIVARAALCLCVTRGINPSEFPLFCTTDSN